MTMNDDDAAVLAAQEALAAAQVKQRRALADRAQVEINALEAFLAKVAPARAVYEEALAELQAAAPDGATTHATYEALGTIIKTLATVEAAPQSLIDLGRRAVAKAQADAVAAATATE